jgi:tetratricopeptide (TPR) repeat protein
VLLALGAVGGLVAAASITAPWLADRAIQRAALEWPTAPQQAFDRLDRAASLNPLSQRPFTIAGSIALRRDDLDRADAAFARALQRTPDDAYAALERGAIASSRGEDERAVALLGRAVALDPRNDLARDALRSARAGERVDVAELNDEILRRARRLGG